MPTVRSASMAGLAFLASLSQVASAATEAKLLSGVCYPIPGSFEDTQTGHSIVGEVNLKPAGTGTFIDDLDTRFGSINEQQRGELPWESLALFNNTGVAAYRISCRDEDGLAILLSKTQPIRINTDRDGTLVIDSYGLIPEPYAYYVDGKRQPGVYFGAAGEVRWAWSQVTDSFNNTLWRPSLMVATDGKTRDLKPGEVQGFLVAKPF